MVFFGLSSRLLPLRPTRNEAGRCRGLEVLFTPFGGFIGRLLDQRLNRLPLEANTLPGFGAPRLRDGSGTLSQLTVRQPCGEKL
jgi:hypothetical protein